MANRAARFVEQETLTPGPGAYQLRNLEVNGKSKHQSAPEGRVCVLTRFCRWVILFKFCADGWTNFYLLYSNRLLFCISLPLFLFLRTIIPFLIV